MSWSQTYFLPVSAAFFNLSPFTISHHIFPTRRITSLNLLFFFFFFLQRQWVSQIKLWTETFIYSTNLIRKKCKRELLFLTRDFDVSFHFSTTFRHFFCVCFYSFMENKMKQNFSSEIFCVKGCLQSHISLPSFCALALILYVSLQCA